MKNILIISQLIVSVVVIILILLQQRGTALGSAFGGGGESLYSTRRGLEKKIYWSTIIFGAIFIILAALNLFYS
ncbi:MAG TPA: preprotein translocase subunit SecG [Candidatus Parcubacteria bacterium]|nr:preprotein translocase subunit SecG [Candidatus Parcubacteria bacterium]